MWDCVRLGDRGEMDWGSIVENMVHYGVLKKAERRFVTKGRCIRPWMGRDAQFS